LYCCWCRCQFFKAVVTGQGTKNQNGVLVRSGFSF
jgi:hypothetical protein